MTGIRFYGFETGEEYARVYQNRMMRAAENFEIYAAQLFSPSVSFRTRAAEALGISEDERAAEYLIKCIQTEEDTGVLYVAAVSLGRLKDRRAVKPLAELLSSDDKWIRKGAAEALGSIGDKETFDLIIPMLSDDNESARAGAAEAVGQMCFWDKIDLIIPLLDDESEIVRKSASKAAKNLGRSDLAED